jgi:Tol biopolymer transport system component
MKPQSTSCLQRASILTVALLCSACAPKPFTLIVDQTPSERWSEGEGELLTNVRQLTFESMNLTKSGEAYFSPDMRRIIFQAYPVGQNEYQQFTLELSADGNASADTIKQVSPGGGACTCGYFRPDGQGIIYGSSYLNPAMAASPSRYHRKGSSYTWNMPGGMDVIAADIDGSNPRQLTTTPGYDAECAYSPDGKQIVFTSDRTGDPDLYVMNADGTNQRQITHTAGYDGGPFFSPDGKRIIFRADRKQDDHLQIFVMNADGTGERQLTSHSDTVNWAPYWLPSGKSVVFTTSLHGHYNYEVYLLNIESGAQRRVTFSKGFDGLPVVSPDGKKLMWTSQRAGSSQIFIADFTVPAGY